ncbi:hypothetical protein J5W72_02625 [Akkermansia muciniphila]|uniref:hypothetical protein n=2 Tax=Akkermansia muciniphila TaxID=239935 RepID=UPI001C061865|nr:hypothetical protein [Akkermansia muciniphila]QWP37111.1 hypothetical protein J5W72_02625 [Akkermansia muciniphila]
MMKDHEENSIPFEDSGIFPGKRKMLLKARNSKGREKAHLRRSSTDFQSERANISRKQLSPKAIWVEKEKRNISPTPLFLPFHFDDPFVSQNRVLTSDWKSDS